MVNSQFYCKAREFARLYPKVAEKVLIPPAFNIEDELVSKLLKSRTGRMESLDTLDKYLDARRWHLPEGHVKEARALVSHTLSYPLTMSLFVSQFLIDAEYKDDKNIVRICCLGARAEATLPVQFWREFLVAIKLTRPELSPKQWIIDFVGPEVPSRKSSSELNLENDCSTLNLNFYNGYFNGNKENNIDGLILFNPGLGHPHLKSSWARTLEDIFNDNLKRNPVFITAHSETDRVRDMTLLAEHIGGSGIEYRINPFLSQMKTQDPFSSEIVQANNFFTFIKGR